MNHRMLVNIAWHIVAAAPALASVRTESVFYATSEVRAPFVHRAVGPRERGMGGAGVASGAGIGAATLNPSALASGSGLELLGFGDLDGLGAGANFLGLGWDAGPVRMGFHAAAALTSYPSFQNDLALTADGTKLAMDSAGGLTVAMPLPIRAERRGRAGVTLGWVASPEGPALVALSVGGAWRLAGPLEGGLAIRNLTPTDFRGPLTAAAGVAATFGRVLGSADVGYGWTDRAMSFTAGAEFAVGWGFAVRAGYAHDSRIAPLGGLAGLSVGIGARVRRLAVDYAFAPQGDLGGVHRFGIGLAARPI